MYSYVGSRPTWRFDPQGLQWNGGRGVDHLPDIELPPGPPPPQSPDDIARELQQERKNQLVLAACIGYIGLLNPVAAVIALIVDTAAGAYILDDPIVVPTNSPKTTPKPPGGGAG